MASIADARAADRASVSGYSGGSAKSARDTKNTGGGGGGTKSTGTGNAANSKPSSADTKNSRETGYGSGNTNTKSSTLDTKNERVTGTGNAAPGGGFSSFLGETTTVVPTGDWRAPAYEPARTLSGVSDVRPMPTGDVAAPIRRAEPSGGLFAAAGMRQAENASMAALDNYRRADLASQARASENSSMAAYDRIAADAADRTSRAGLASQSRVAENASMDSYVDAIIDQIVGVESAGNPKAKNPLSSAQGLGQFIDSTWLRTIEKHRPDLMAGRTRAEVLALKTDPVISRAMTKAYAQDNIKYLQANDVPVTQSSIYATHFLGPDGAVNAYKADPSKSASEVLGAGVVKANAGIMSGKTIGQVLSYIDNKMSPTFQQRERTVSLPDAVSVPPSRVERFASTYLGSGAAGAREAMIEQGVDPDGPVAQAMAGLNERALTAPGGGLYTAAAVSPDRAPPAAATTPPRAAVPAPSAKPAAPPSAPPVAQPAAVAPATPDEDSVGKQILAGGVDVLGGMIPGIGTALTIANAGLALTGRDTIGKMIVDRITLGKGGNLEGVPAGEGGNYEGQIPKKKKVAATPAERFDEVYLPFKDSVTRPTPEQKWGRAS